MMRRAASLGLIGIGAFLAAACMLETSELAQEGEAELPLQDYGSFQTSYYPYGNEYWSHTVCGSTAEFGGMFLAVTERSPLWSGACTDAWASCDANPKCRDYWNRIPEFFEGRRIKDPATRRVLEPACNLGATCGKPIQVTQGTRSATAYVWDACPAYHWNNVLAIQLYGRNPCAMGSRHVDMWRNLYESLGGNYSGNIPDVRITDLGYTSGGGFVCDGAGRDRQPTPEYTCAQQRSWGKCNEPWMTKDGGYCNATCGRCATATWVCDGANRDRQPSPDYSCAQQRSWGKCNEPWMTKDGGYCNATCGRCSTSTWSCDAASRDRQPSPDYSCAQQRSWGKCNEAWMLKDGGYCNATCGRC
jgi:hypothetical protein